MSDESEIRSAIAAYGDAIRSIDIPGLERLWDRTYAHLVYQPEEHKHACRNWEEIVAYWSYIPTVVESIRQWDTIDLDVAVIGDAALVYALFTTSFQLKGVTEPLDGEVRFTFGLHRTPAGWRFVHAHESRQLIVPEAGAA